MDAGILLGAGASSCSVRQRQTRLREVEHIGQRALCPGSRYGGRCQPSQQQSRPREPPSPAVPALTGPDELGGFHFPGCLIRQCKENNEVTDKASPNFFISLTQRSPNFESADDVQYPYNSSHHTPTRSFSNCSMLTFFLQPVTPSRRNATANSDTILRYIYFIIYFCLFNYGLYVNGLSLMRPSLPPMVTVPILT